MWFDLAEGSFPYPSSYIPFALLHKTVNLPAWPMQHACWSSGLHQHWGIDMDGNLTEVTYDITYGDSALVLTVDWGNVTSASSSTVDTFASIRDSNDIVGLLTSVRKAISVWHNVTKDVKCFDVHDHAPNKGRRKHVMSNTLLDQKKYDYGALSMRRLKKANSKAYHPTEDPQSCQEKMRHTGSWEPVCCNDEMNLIITEAQGLGRDFFWPPSLPRGVNSYRDVMRNVSLGPCPDPDGIFGYSKENYDPWSTWLDTLYGSSRMIGHSNIIFSNGLLDPWAAGGVFAISPFQENGGFTGSMVQNVTDTDIIALIIEFGGHHTDLMYSNVLDPQCVTKARAIEKSYITKWISDWATSGCPVRQK
jgi:Serine carboxypeptidase S28